MPSTAPFDIVMRSLADPTRRAVFERIARADETTVAELTEGSGVTQSAISQHLRSLKEAGLVADRAPETIWKTLTTGDLIGRWLMAPSGFEPVKGNRFTFQTKPAGAWDGVIRCEVLEAVPNERLAYAWRSGDENNVGYGSALDTVVTWTLTRVEGGTRLRLVHAGFVT